MTTLTIAPIGRMHLRWGRVAVTVLLLEVVLVAAAFAWVAFYSYVIRPGGDGAYYEAYAKMASPIVCIVVGMPAFFAAGRWLGGVDGLPAVLAMVASYVAIDVLLVGIFATEDLTYVWLISALSHSTKLVAAYLGARRAVTGRAA